MNIKREDKKYFIYIHPEYASKLEADARYFEILKKDKNNKITNQINMNKFLNMLVKGYYERFSNVDKYLFDANRFGKAKNTKGNSKQIIIRPSKDNRSLFEQIERSHSQSNGISGYFSLLLMSYCELAMYKREQIIFCDIYEKLKKVSNHKTRSRIKFGIKNSNVIHEVIPYEIAVSKEEMYNYLISAEIVNGKQVETPFRLTHIVSVNSVPGDTVIDSDVERHLMNMDKYGPQYSIEEDVKTCVRLTDQGVDAYSKIYFGRPERIPNTDDPRDDGTYYYFDCSTNQIFLYFRRFGCEAEIIYPEELRNRMKEFHANALAIYKKG